VRQLPAQRVAALIYRGDVDHVPAYRAIRAWIGMTGLAVTGPKRELFLRGPSTVTEIQFPVERPARITRAAAGHSPAHPTRSSR
jgi:effector-binding domain-containing protein